MAMTFVPRIVIRITARDLPSVAKPVFPAASAAASLEDLSSRISPSGTAYTSSAMRSVTISGDTLLLCTTRAKSPAGVFVPQNRVDSLSLGKVVDGFVALHVGEHDDRKDERVVDGFRPFLDIVV